MAKAKALKLDWTIAAAAAGVLYCIHRIRKGVKSTSGIGAIDRDAVREILLWFENDHDLYDRFNVPIANMLVKKMRKGAQLDLETLAKSSMIDNVVRETLRSYWRRFGSFPIDPETRKAMKHEIAQSILIYAQDQFDYENENA